MKVEVQMKGETKRSVEVDDRLFGTEASPLLIAQAVRTALANRRLSPAHTKTRGEVSGGGAKPWRQKGTGRARVGSSRTPIWRHGGVTFGPTPEINHHLRFPARMGRQALLGALAAAWREGQVTVISDLSLERPSTKGLLSALAASGVTPRRAVLVVATPDEAVFRSADNLAQLRAVSVDHLTMMDILSAEQLICTESALKALDAKYGGER
jgi:large subunit ribosomal protein L4